MRFDAFKLDALVVPLGFFLWVVLRYDGNMRPVFGVVTPTPAATDQYITLGNAVPLGGFGR